MPKKLCKQSKEKYERKKADKPKYECKKCGRVAKKDDAMCKSQKIGKNSCTTE